MVEGKHYLDALWCTYYVRFHLLKNIRSSIVKTRCMQIDFQHLKNFKKGLLV